MQDSHRVVMLALMHTETSKLHKQAARAQARLACFYEHINFHTYAEMARKQERYETVRAAYLMQKGNDILNKSASMMPLLQRTSYETDFIRKFRRKLDLLELKVDEKNAVLILMHLQTPDMGVEPTTTR